MKPAKNWKLLTVQPEYQSEFNKDIWDGRKLGADIRPNDRYIIDFKTISPFWLRQAAKQYIRKTFANLSWASCVGKKNALRRFSLFLAKYRPACLASDIDRLLIVEFLAYLVGEKLAAKTRLNTIVDLNIFFRLCSRNGWADIDDKVLFDEDDFPALNKPLPRYIPQ